MGRSLAAKGTKWFSRITMKCDAGFSRKLYQDMIRAMS